MSIYRNKWFKRIIWMTLAVASTYGLGRLYFKVTDGFSMSNISSEYAYNPRWETRELSVNEEHIVDNALSQTYHYLGKGCQSYVFASEDNQYVLKFFKYQRYRLQPWLTVLPSFPFIENYRQKKINEKERKRESFFASWKVAFDKLKEESGLVYVHLNKTHNLNKHVVIIDKIGMKHDINLDEMEFLIQKRADMLCPTLLVFRDKKDLEGAKRQIERLLAVIISEYQRGLADNDHALMQNTGVLDGAPIHIDIGQFIYNDIVKDPKIYKQELFTKTYKFRLWLKEEYPELLPDVEKQLQSIIGPDFYTMKPIWKIHEERIPNVG